MWGIEAKRPKYRQDERRLLLVPVGDILPNPDQPRREFAYDKLLELAQSIDENGLLNPVTITLRGDKPVLVAGERRLRAAKIAGLREDVYKRQAGNRSAPRRETGRPVRCRTRHLPRTPGPSKTFPWQGRPLWR